MSRRVWTALLMVSLMGAGPAEASRLRYAGRAVSDSGLFGRITTTLRPVNPDTFAGPFQCMHGPVGRCISRRGSMTLTFTSEGFEPSA